MKGITLTSFKICCIVAEIKTVQCLWRDRYTDQRNNKEHKTDPCKYDQLTFFFQLIFFYRGVKAIQWKKDRLSTNGAVAIGHP